VVPRPTHPTEAAAAKYKKSRRVAIAVLPGKRDQIAVHTSSALAELIKAPKIGDLQMARETLFENHRQLKVPTKRHISNPILISL
jgi:hypothetical protein